MSRTDNRVSDNEVGRFANGLPLITHGGARDERIPMGGLFNDPAARPNFQAPAYRAGVVFVKHYRAVVPLQEGVSSYEPGKGTLLECFALRSRLGAGAAVCHCDSRSSGTKGLHG